MSEETKDEGAPEAPSMETLVDKPKLTDTARIADPPREAKPPREPKAPKPEPGYVPLREVLDERERRQKAEQDAQKYRAAWEQHQQKLADAENNDPAPDMFKDPNAYNAWVDRQLDRRAKGIAKQHIEPLQQRLSDYAVGMSEMRAKSVLGDKFKPFEEWLIKQPNEFKDQCMASDDPYAVAYQQYRTRTTFERLGNDDLDSYEAKLKAKWLAEMQGPADPDDDIVDPPQQKPAPRSFAGGRSNEPKGPGQQWTGPQPLGAILAEKSHRKR